MNIRITELKEVDADLSNVSLKEIEELFCVFLDEVCGNLSDKKYKKFLKRAEKQIKYYQSCGE